MTQRSKPPMKAILSLLLLAMLPVYASAQKVEKKFIDKLCECSKKLDARLDAKTLTPQVQNCVDIAVAVCREELASNFNNQKKYEDLDGYVTSLILETAIGCPEFKQLYVKVEYQNVYPDGIDNSGILHDNPTDCLMAHQGTFHQYIPETGDTAWFSRKGNIQFEGITASKDYIKYELEWIDECTYSIAVMEVSNKEYEAFFTIGQVFVVNITNVTGQRYSYYTLVNEIKLNGEMIKVSDAFTNPKK